MPVYEYRCAECGRKFSALVASVALAEDESCPHCGASAVRRLVSKFARGRSEDDRLDSISDQMDVVGDPESPGEMRKMARELGKALDDDASDELEEMLESDFEGGDDDAP